MDIAQLLYDLFFDYTLRTVALGAAILGVVSGMLGSFAVLRKQSLLGDAISHAALPGIVLIALSVLALLVSILALLLLTVPLYRLLGALTGTRSAGRTECCGYFRG